jgi:hypothetical protein
VREGPEIAVPRGLHGSAEPLGARSCGRLPGHRPLSFTRKILLAMLAGAAIGVVLNLFGELARPLTDFLVDGVFHVVGRVFIALLQMMVVPLVLVSLVCGVTSLGDMRALGRLGAKTLGIYLVTTAIALMLALTLALLISPGEGFTLAGDVELRERAAPRSDRRADRHGSRPTRCARWPRGRCCRSSCSR